MSKAKEMDDFKATDNCYWRIVKNEPTEQQIQYEFFQWFLGFKVILYWVYSLFVGKINQRNLNHLTEYYKV